MLPAHCRLAKMLYGYEFQTLGAVTPGAGPYARDGAEQCGADAVEAEQKQVANGRDREQPAQRPPCDDLLSSGCVSPMS